MALAPVVALEIGTSKISALVGEMRDDGHVMITGMGEQPSIGVRKGEITDLENAVSGVREALSAAEESGKVAIREVHVAVSGGHIRCMTNRGAVPVSSSDREITEDDVEQVMEVARTVNLPPDREVIHTIGQHYCIDDQQSVVQPEGMEGAKLSMDMLVVHGVRTRLHNSVRVVQSIPMEVRDVAFSGLCSALAVLTPEQKQTGVVVIDMGGGTTDYLAYANGIVAAAGSLGVGGDHVTIDVALAFNIPTSQAEKLKKEHGAAVFHLTDSTQRIGVAAEGGFAGRSVHMKSLNRVINARIDETLGMIKRELEAAHVMSHIGAGIVLTGGGAHLGGVANWAQHVFGLPCSIGIPRNVSGLATATEGPEYATCSGLVHYAFRTMGGRRPASSIGKVLKGLFRLP